jgi:hypothetical protein
MVSHVDGYLNFNVCLKSNVDSVRWTDQAVEKVQRSMAQMSVTLKEKPEEGCMVFVEYPVWMSCDKKTKETSSHVRICKGGRWERS